MKTAIVWFKTDLRLEDNEALLKQLHTETMLPVYCFDDSEFEITKYGYPKTGSFSTVSIGIFN
jgi:deoxyribodipyrimidine photo-lyase